MHGENREPAEQGSGNDGHRCLELSGSHAASKRDQPASFSANRSTLAWRKPAGSPSQIMQATVASGRAIRTTLKAFTSPRLRVEVAVPA